MFVSVTNCKSTSVDALAVNAKTNQALVTYKGSEQPYLYSGVSFDAIIKLILTEVDSIGQWVNTNLKQDSNVSFFTV